MRRRWRRRLCVHARVAVDRAEIAVRSLAWLRPGRISVATTLRTTAVLGLNASRRGASRIIKGARRSHRDRSGQKRIAAQNGAALAAISTVTLRVEHHRQRRARLCTHVRLAALRLAFPAIACVQALSLMRRNAKSAWWAVKDSNLRPKD